MECVRNKEYDVVVGGFITVREKKKKICKRQNGGMGSIISYSHACCKRYRKQFLIDNNIDFGDYRKGIMYTSIPYYKGWKAYVDGEQADIIKIGNALCGVKLSSGSHTVEFKYFPYGFKLGLIISMIGIFVAGGIEFYNKRKGLGVREG